VGVKTHQRGSHEATASGLGLINRSRLNKKNNQGQTWKESQKNHGTQDSRVVPHRGTNWAALWLTAQIGRDAVLSERFINSTAGTNYRDC
jgi:hypothetical protein